MSTPHIGCNRGDFAKTVLMPGDPLRAKYIADTYLTDAKLVNNVRGVQGYTGLYKGKRISVMASGMGMPSIGIYSYELFSMYDVECIIRVGTAGAISEKLNVRDVVIGQGACTNSNYASQYMLPGTFAPIGSYELISRAVETAKKMNLNYLVGNLYSSDTFYDDSMRLDSWNKMGVLAVEMEAAALYMNAARLDKKALAICTISDCPFRNIALDAAARQSSFNDMMIMALEIAEY